MSRVTVCFIHGCKLQKSVTFFFDVDVRDRNHRQVKWTLTYWRVTKNHQTIPGRNGIETTIIKTHPFSKNSFTYYGGWTKIIFSKWRFNGDSWWKWKKCLKQTPQETHHFPKEFHTTCVFFALPRCGAALEAAVTPRAVTSLEAESPRHVGMSWNW